MSSTPGKRAEEPLCVCRALEVPEPPQNKLEEWAIWSATRMTLERETVRGFLSQLKPNSMDLLLLQRDAEDQHCGMKDGAPNLEALAVRLLTARLESLQDEARRTGTRQSWCSEKVVHAFGQKRLFDAVTQALLDPSVRCIVGDIMHSQRELVFLPAWPAGHDRARKLIIDMRKREGPNGWTDTSGDLTERSLVAFLLGHVQPVGKLKPLPAPESAPVVTVEKLAAPELKPCPVPVCGRGVFSRGLCQTHYRKAKRLSLLGAVLTVEQLQVLAEDQRRK
jgi:hypothetical protein